MALHLWYHDSDVGTIEITDHVKYGEGNIRLTMTAEQGTQDTNEIIVEDPDGIFNFKGLQIFFATEDEAEFERIYTGQVWIKSVERGDYYRTGAARVWTLQVQNINEAFYAYVMTGEDDSRPAETDVERIQWLLSTNEASPFTDVTTYVFTDRPVDMDANPDSGYNGQMFNQVFDDCSQQSGKNWYALDYFDEDEDDYKQAVWYGHDEREEFASEATISNVLSEVDNETVFWPDIATKLDRDPSRVFSGIFANYDGGWTYRSRAETITAFHHRDTVVSWPNVKTEAKANARADRMLLTFAGDGEEDAVTCTIYSMLPSQASVFRAGHRVDGVKFTHLPGWENGRDCRIVRRTLIDQAEGLYAMELELLPIGPAISASSCTTAVVGLEMYDSGTQSGGPPCAVSPSTPSTYPALVLTFMSMAQDGTCIGPPIVGPSLTVSGFDEVQKYQGAPAACEHSLLMVASKALTSGSPGSMSCTFTGNGAEAYRAIGITIPTSETEPVQVAQQDGGGSTITLPSPPTPGNLLVMFRMVETNNWTSTPGTGWTQIGTQVATKVGISEHIIDMWVRCVQSGDPDTYGNGDASFSHWSFLSEWALT